MVKEACCRQIIKFFETESRNLSQSHQAAAKSKSKKAKDKKGGEDEEGEGAQRKMMKQDRVRLEDEDDKVDFVKLVKPLLLTMQSDNQELAAMAAIALVNLCNYSEDIKEIFFQLKGLNVLLEYLTDKREIILENVLRLMQILMAKSEQHTKKICEDNDQEAVKSLLKILEGPGLKNTSYPTKIILFVLNILRQMIRHSFKAKATILKNKNEETNKSSLSVIVDMVKPES